MGIVFLTLFLTDVTYSPKSVVTKSTGYVVVEVQTQGLCDASSFLNLLVYFSVSPTDHLTPNSPHDKMLSHHRALA